jgi:hypothetical protein
MIWNFNIQDIEKEKIIYKKYEKHVDYHCVNIIDIVSPIVW